MGKHKHNCKICNSPWYGSEKDGIKEGWRFHKDDAYCPLHSGHGDEDERFVPPIVGD